MNDRRAKEQSFWDKNPIERVLFAAEQAGLATDPAVIAEWQALSIVYPGGWLAEDDDGKGPWWYVFEDSGKTKVTARGAPDYDLITAALTKRRGKI